MYFLFNLVCQDFGPKLILRLKGGQMASLRPYNRLPLQIGLRPPGLVAVLVRNIISPTNLVHLHVICRILKRTISETSLDVSPTPKKNLFEDGLVHIKLRPIEL